jgi:hypothetical protein
MMIIKKFKHRIVLMLNILILRPVAKNNVLMRSVYKNRREYLALGFLSDMIINSQNTEDNKITILAGPFEGVKYKKYTNPTEYYGNTELVQKVFGLYEQEILNFISVSHFDKVIDIGAGDGYYGIGLIAKNYVSKAYFYETDDYRASHIKINASINDIQGDKILLRKTANPILILNDIDNDGVSQKTLIICDIEGWEYDLFTEPFLNDLKKRNVYILLEYHPHLIEKIKNKDSNHDFLKLLKNSYDVTTLDNMARNLTNQLFFAPLVNDRWLLVSELRSEGIQLLLRENIP